MTNELQQQKDNNLTLVEKLRLKKRQSSNAALLLDVSYSMSTDVEPGIPKIQALRETVSGLHTDREMFWFSSDFGSCTKDTIPNPMGGTNLSGLLKHIKEKGYKSCIILTDGDISDKAETLRSKGELNIKVMYIGAGPRPAFLDQLASSGIATTEDLKQTKQLTEKVQLLLESSAIAPEKKGPIQL